VQPGGAIVYWNILRGASVIGFYSSGLSPSLGSQVPFNAFVLDTPSAGTYTYTVQAWKTGSSGCSLNQAVLIAYEL
jgi:hypothetical protein